MRGSDPGVIEAAVITRTDFGYEIVNSRDNLIAHLRDWESLASLFRDADYSEEYIAKRKILADKNHFTRLRTFADV